MENAVKVVVANFATTSQRSDWNREGIYFIMIHWRNECGQPEKDEITIYSSAAEYLTYVAAVGDNADSMEMRYEDENIWLTQKMMAQLYDVSVQNIGQHIKKVLDDGELTEDAVVKKYFITAADGNTFFSCCIFYNNCGKLRR